jgi:hypothetical protein
MTVGKAGAGRKIRNELCPGLSPASRTHVSSIAVLFCVGVHLLHVIVVVDLLEYFHEVFVIVC